MISRVGVTAGIALMLAVALTGCARLGSVPDGPAPTPSSTAAPAPAPSSPTPATDDLSAELDRAASDLGTAGSAVTDAQNQSGVGRFGIRHERRQVTSRPGVAGSVRLNERVIGERGMVVIVEDERAIAELERLYLTQAGFGVHRSRATGRPGSPTSAACRRSP